MPHYSLHYKLVFAYLGIQKADHSLLPVLASKYIPKKTGVKKKKETAFQIHIAIIHSKTYTTFVNQRLSHKPSFLKGQTAFWSFILTLITARFLILYSNPLTGIL